MRVRRLFCPTAAVPTGAVTTVTLPLLNVCGLITADGRLTAVHRHIDVCGLPFLYSKRSRCLLIALRPSRWHSRSSLSKRRPLVTCLFDGLEIDSQSFA